MWLLPLLLPVNVTAFSIIYATGRLYPFCVRARWKEVFFQSGTSDAFSLAGRRLQEVKSDLGPRSGLILRLSGNMRSLQMSSSNCWLACRAVKHSCNTYQAVLLQVELTFHFCHLLLCNMPHFMIVTAVPAVFGIHLCILSAYFHSFMLFVLHLSLWLLFIRYEDIFLPFVLSATSYSYFIY